MSYTEAQGYGSPFFRIYYAEEELTPSVSFFKINHKEKEGTSIELIIETDNPTLPDEAPYQEHAKLEIVHGYINGPNSKPITYYVRECYPSYLPTGITIRMKLADRASYMKEMASLARNPLDEDKDSVEKKLARRADLLGILQKNYGMQVKVMGLNLENLDTILDDNDKLSEEYKAFILKKKTDEFIQTFGQSLTFYNIDASYAGIGKMVRQEIKDIEEILGFLKEPLTNNAASNKKDHHVVKDTVKGAPKNIKITTEGDEMNIEPRNFNQAPRRVYKYKSESSFIEFNPETKNRSQSSSATNINILIPDRDNKTYLEENITEGEDDSPRLAPGVKLANPDEKYTRLQTNAGGVIRGTGRYKGGSTRGSTQGINSSIAPTEVGINVFGFGTKQNVITRYKDPKDPSKGVEDIVLLESVRYDGVSSSYLKPDGIQTAARDETSTQFRPVAIMNAQEYIEARMGAEEGEIARNDGKNKRNESSVQMNPGTLKVIYDPELKNKIVVRVENVSKKTEGNYYVIDCEHHFQRGQYAYTLLNVARSGRGITGNENFNTVDVRDIGKNVVEFKNEQRNETRSVKVIKPKTGKE
jgi:hypothetical protein